MALSPQTVQIQRTDTNTPPGTLLSGSLSIELGPYTRLWVGSSTGNRLLLSSQPGDTTVSSGLYLPISGGTLTGPLTLAAAPTVPLGAATKGYADLKLALSGGVLTGPLTLAADPSAAMGAVTKQYADTKLSLSGGTVSGGTTFTAGIILASPSNINIGGGSPGQVLTAGASNGLVTWVAPSVSNNVGRNLLHNPLFNIAQRGNGPFSVTNSYAQDRWRIEANLDAITLSNAAAPDFMRTQIGDEAATVFAALGVTGNASAAAYSVFNQRIEDVRRLGGKTVTVSFWAVLNSGATKIGVSIDQNFGTGGSPSATVSPAGQSVTLSTTWTRYSLTFTMPSIIGKTLGTNGDSYTALYFWFSSGATQNARAGGIGVQTHGPNLWGVQLEIGSAATPLEKLDPLQDLAKCQRFYQIGNLFLNGYQAISNSLGIGSLLPVPMRATPTVLVGPNNNSSGTGAITFGAVGNATVYATGIASATGACSINTNFVASADL